ncbi:glycine--tRNA ligase subunit beta, partial [candidate division WOR-3 bacterium]|nr:glycine--tRNA ligase subunit beta [candidate division WOR-3 bacterium]MBD3364776.1 glycine--tRNA ligase subunit beta [candidate division WOR-3 bacterium]
EYLQKLKDAYVIVDPNERRKLIHDQLKKAAKTLGGTLVEDNELLDEVTNMVEYPNVLVCDLGGFTDLPRQVLQTALAKHQRAFVVEKKGKIIPHFLVVTNSPKIKPDLARPWFERMAISRLEDADFFIKEDLDKGLKPLVEEEARVEWIKGIGSLADKTRFLTELGTFLSKDVNGFDKEAYNRAAQLAKADLLSNLVREKEFTSLQGTAGAIYAERLGESKEVCTAIGSQYSDSPTTLEGSVLGIADRLLNICATFLVGKPPKGSRDPFALRRQATAVMKILTDLEIHTQIPKAIKKVLSLFGKKEKQEGQIADFLRDRQVLFFKDKDFAYDWVDAVAAVAADDPYDAFLRLKAFGELDKGDEFRLVAVGQKRVANITRSTQFSLPDASLFGQVEEKKLWEETERIRPEVESAVGSRNYKKALELLLSIRPAIDNFFDEVFVMVEDEEVKNNRLHLLNSVKQEFLKVADFSKIVVEGGRKIDTTF